MSKFVDTDLASECLGQIKAIGATLSRSEDQMDDDDLRWLGVTITDLAMRGKAALSGVEETAV